MTLKLNVLPQHWNGAVPRFVCATEVRPCRREDCGYHLRERQTRTVEEMPETCAIDVAERRADDGTRGASLREIARYMGVDKRIVLRMQSRALKKLERQGLKSFR